MPRGEEGGGGEGSAAGVVGRQGTVGAGGGGSDVTGAGDLGGAGGGRAGSAGVKKEVVPRVEKQAALPFFWLASIASVPAFVSRHRQHARWEWALTRPQPPLATLAYRLYYLRQASTLFSSSS